MTGIDTSVLVRHLAQDDETRPRAVLTMLLKKNATFFGPDIVLAEVDWVLSTLYRWTPDEVAESFGRLLTVHNLMFADEGRIRGVLRALQQGADLPGELIVNRCLDMGCKTLASHDKGMLRRHRGFVVSPT